MTSFRYTLRLKKAAFIMILAFSASSLFAFVLPTIFHLEGNEKDKIEKNLPIVAHPLTGNSDNVVICPNDGSELHEIFLCGSSAERLITTNITDLKQIIWSKLQEGSCSAAQANCANSSPTCTWDQVETNTQYNVTEGGEYRIYVQYNDNTSDRFYFNVYANTLNPTAVVTNIDCGTDGNITINNAPSSYEYSISGGASWQDSNTFPIASVGNYDILTRRKDDTDGCIFELDDIVVANNAINADTPIVVAPTCDSEKGSIQVTINDASSTYIYKISQGGSLVNSSGPITASTYTFSDLNAGDYDIEVTLASISSCIWNAIETVPAFVAIQPNAIVTKNIDCTDGVITVTPSGGTAPYEYSLDGVTYLPFTDAGQTTVSIANPGPYNLKIKDVSNCVVDANTVLISTEPEIVATTTPQDVSCNATDDGSVTVNINNTEGYSITYSTDGTTFQTSNVFSNLMAGTYTITLRKQKAGGTCDLTLASVDVESSPAFTVSATITQQISCTTGSASIATSITTGGTSPFEYSLDGVNFQTSSDLTGLGAGDYTITVKDFNGCTTTVDQTVSAGSNPSDLNFLTSDIDCATGATDVQLIVQNGSAPYEYKITAPASASTTSPGDTFLGLLPNTYTFEVTSNGCTIIRNFVVPEPISFTTNAIVKTNVSCFTGAIDGSIELSVENFNTSFTVIVEDGTGSDTGLGVINATSSPIIFSGLAADDYTLKITDTASPCEKIQTLTIAAPSAELTIDSFTTNPINCGNAGSASINAIGGWGSYTYQIEQPDGSFTAAQSSNTITGLIQVGTHTIILKDVNGCEVTTTFDLQDQGGPVAAVDISAVSPTHYCYDNANRGVLKIDITDGEAPFYYTVNNGTPMLITGGTFTLSNLTPDDYIVEIIGDNGCKTTVLDTKISGQLFALAQITKPLGCGATPDAIIEVTPQEGYLPYTYQVDSGSGYTAAIMPYSASTIGFYTFLVTDDKGCTFTTEPVEIINSPPLTSSHNVSDTACGKEGTGSIELVGVGGTPPFTYSFEGSPFSTQTVYPGLDATTYSYSIRDALGCELTDVQAIVGAEAAVTADIVKTDITCDPLNGGTQWGNVNVNNIQNATGLVNIRLIRVNSIAAHAAGTARYWTYRNYEDIDMSTRPAGYNIRMYWPLHFYVEVTDEKGCVFESEAFTIDQPELPWIQKPEVDLEQSCASGATFQVEVGNPTDLVGPFKYRIWPYDEDNPPTWRDFQPPYGTLPNGTIDSNPAYGEDTDVGPNERDLRVSGLLFGVSYAIVLYDEATGCQRWRSLGTVAAPEAPNNAIDVTSTPQSLSCYTGLDGKVKFTVHGADDFNGDGTKTVDWTIRHSSDYGQGGSIETNYRQSGTATDGGSGGDIEIDVTDLRVAWYVVEVTTESGCRSGNRFLIYRPKSKLQIELDQYATATCNIGAQIAVLARGGWDSQAYFNVRNKLDQASWHEYEYAFVVNGTDPTALAASDWSSSSFQTITPTAYDGVNNIYQVYVRDGGGCIAGLGTPITITKDVEPIIDSIAVTDRCTSTNELYNVVADLGTNLGTNPDSGAPKYIWDGEVTNSATKTLGPGYHTLEVRDENGCTDSQTIHIYPQMVATSEITKTVDCDISLNNGEMLADAYGGSGNFEFTISPIPSGYASGEETNATGIFTRLEPGIDYIYTVTDLDNSCGPQNSPALQLITPADPQFEVESTSSITCFGANDGKIILKQVDTADNLDVNYEYSIDGGGSYQASNVFENLASGNYSIDIRSAKNCVQTLTGINISDATQVTLSVPAPSAFQCTADNSLGMATITANAGGGSAPYSYSFDGSSFISSNTYQLPYLTTARTVVVDVVDAKGCTSASAVTITIPAAEKVVASIVVVSGPMNCSDDEVINILGSGSNQTVYEVRELPSGNIISGSGHVLPAGNPGIYSFEITDTVTGCTDKVNYTIDAFDTVEISLANAIDLSCKDALEGSFELTVTGYTGAFSYDVYDANGVYRTGETGNTSTVTTVVNLLPAGSYSVEVTATDFPKCTVKSDQISIQSPTESLDFNSSITQQITCDPGNDSQITATPRGGWGGYVFELFDSTNTMIAPDTGTINVFSDLSAGNYEMLLRDNKGCETVLRTITVDPIAQIVIDPAVVKQDTSCPRADDGSITVTASRSDALTGYSFQYFLTNLSSGVTSVAQSSSTFADLVEGDYTVTVTDGYGCDQTTATIEIRDPATLELYAEITQEIDCITDHGIIRLSATGGSGVFEYSIISPASAVTPYSSTTDYTLLPDTYEFSVRDSNNPGCISPLTVISTINDIQEFSTVFTDTANTIINCNGDSDAVLIAESKGGLGEYQYQLIFNGNPVGVVQDTGVFENLGPGAYRIRGTGIGGCQDDTDDEITIEEPELLVVSLGAVEEVQCFQEENGSITINATGEAPFQYIISSQPQKAVNTNVFENLPGGTYTVTIQDANGCSDTITDIFVNAPSAAFEAEVVRTEREECSTDDNGLIEMDLSGGTAPYAYNLTGYGDPSVAITGNTLTLNNLDGGFYSIYIEDANGCEQFIYQEVIVGVDLAGTVETVYECRDGEPFSFSTITLANEELNSEVLYALDSESPNNAQESPVFENVAPGTHYISVMHEGGCIQRIEDVVIEAADPLVLTALEGTINEILVEASGGDGNYTYYFDDLPSSSGSHFINQDGNYLVRVVDGKGCETSIEVPLVYIDIEIPNFFTPDGDGYKDTWVIKNSEGFPDMYVRIFDRYGRTLKEYIGPGEWDGSYNKADLPTGDYWYVIKLNGPNDKREFVGSFTVYR